MIFIIKGFRTIVFIFIVISTNNKDEDNSLKNLNDKLKLSIKLSKVSSLTTTV